MTMHRLLPLLVFVFLFFRHASAREQLSFFGADHPNLRYTGRIDFSNPKQPLFWMPGVSVSFRFSGTTCILFIRDEVKYGSFHNYINIVLDGKPKRIQLTDKENRIVAAENLTDTDHLLEIVKDTEAGIGFISFIGVECTELKVLPAGAFRKMEFIGNSITCGTGSDQSLVPCGKAAWHDQHNAYQSYGAVTARSVNAQYHLTAVSGIGLQYSCCNLGITMPQVFDKINMRDDSLVWNFSNYVPDVVTICLGQNDGIRDTNSFVQSYLSFVRKVQAVYPAATIVCLTSPMADTALRRYQELTISKVLLLANDQTLHAYFFKRAYNGGCDAHPSLEEHQQIAGELSTYIKKLMKWE
jgi:hypothetical protein